MKPPGGFEPANPRFVIGKHVIISLLFLSNKVMHKRFKIFKPNLINKTYLLPIRTSDYSNEVYNFM